MVNIKNEINGPRPEKTNILHNYENQLRSYIVIATRIVQLLHFQNDIFAVSVYLLRLYSSVSVGPVWKSHVKKGKSRQ